MSFEYNNGEFSDTGIKELSFNELEVVNGGIAPLAAAAAAIAAGISLLASELFHHH